METKFTKDRREVARIYRQSAPVYVPPPPGMSRCAECGKDVGPEDIEGCDQNRDTGCHIAIPPFWSMKKAP